MLARIGDVLERIDAVRAVFDYTKARVNIAPLANVAIYVAQVGVFGPVDLVKVAEEGEEVLLPVLINEPFGGDDAPIRIGLVCQDRTVLQLWFSLSHLPFDGSALTLLEKALFDSIYDVESSALGMSTRELIEHESSPEMINRSQGQIDRWIDRAMMMRSGRGLLSMEPGTFSVTIMRSTSVAAATHRISSRTGVSTTSVVLSAVSATVRSHFREDLEAMLFVSNNRSDRTLRDYIGQTIGNGLVMLPKPGALQWEDYVKRVYMETLHAYRDARYDNIEWRRSMRALSQRGLLGDLSFYFNDVRYDRKSWSRLERFEGLALERDEIIEQGEILALGDATLFANLNSDGEQLVLQFTCDNSVISPDAAATALRAVADLLHAESR